MKKYLSLFWTMFKIGLFTFGGGYAMIALFENEFVENKRFLDRDEFLDVVAIAESTPGPIAINAATFVGMRMAGLPGALAATFGCVLPSLAIVTLLSWLYARYRSGKAMQTVLGTLRPVVVALIASAALSLIYVACTMADGSFSWAGAAVMLAAFAVLRWKKCSPILVMASCGACGILLHACGWM
jgi:chromate transporter